MTIEGARGGWIIVRDESGKQHHVREHNLRDAPASAAHVAETVDELRREEMGE